MHISLNSRVILFGDPIYHTEISSFSVGKNSSCSGERSQSTRTVKAIDGIFSTDVRRPKSFSSTPKSIGNVYSQYCSRHLSLVKFNLSSNLSTFKEFRDFECVDGLLKSLFKTLAP